MELRPYQTEFVDKCLAAWNDHKNILGVAATGAGKTILASEIMHRTPGRSLFLADATELIIQNADKYRRHTGDFASVEMAEHKASLHSKVVVASSQSMHRRLDKYAPDHFERIIIDECFPAGTLIDGKPIESFQTGDKITAFDERTGKLKQSTVTDVMRHEARELVTVTTKLGAVTCTPNHPFWTRRGWVAAGKLTTDDSLLTNETDLHKLPNGIHPNQGADSQPKVQTPRGLDMLAQVPVCALLTTSHGKQSHAQRGDSRKGINQVAGDGVEANGTGRQRQAETTGASGDCGNAWMGNGGCGLHESEPPGRIPAPLQVGHWKPRPQNRNRDRRQFTRSVRAKRARPEKRCALAWVRVASVARIQAHGTGKPGASSGTCVVYNLTVARYSTYTANGFVVHNCHRNTLGEMSAKILRHFESAQFLGVTATPFRSDRKQLGDVYESIAVEIGLERLIREGWLSRIHIKGVPLAIDLRNVRTVAGDYSADDLNTALEPHLFAACEMIADHVQDGARKKVVVFVPLVATAVAFADTLRKLGVRAIAASGKDRSGLESFTHGDAQVAVNAALLTTGWDYPPVDCVCVLRPTKSLSLYQQMIGRGTRCIYAPGYDLDTQEGRIIAMREGPKPNLLVLDPLYLADDHRLITPARLIARDEEQSEALEERINEGRNKPGAKPEDDEGLDLLDMDSDVRSQREQKLAERIKERSRNNARLVDAVEFSLSLHAAEGAEYTPNFAWEEKPPSPGQIAFLERNGFSIESISCRGHASKIIDVCIARRDAGLASPKQMKYLTKFKHPSPETCSFTDAKAYLDAAFAGNLPHQRRREPVKAAAPVAVQTELF